jgi:hypothetical protein
MKDMRTGDRFSLSTAGVEFPRMDDKPIPTAPDFPPDMVNAVRAAAARDADAVGLFLHQLGLTGSPQRPRKLPAGFLLHLAAALRLSAWETQGFFFHHAAGLPPAEKAISDAFDALADANANPTELCIAVMRLLLERFAWNGPGQLNADIALDELSDEAALDVLAQFLWTHRHVATPKEECQP